MEQMIRIYEFDSPSRVQALMEADTEGDWLIEKITPINTFNKTYVLVYFVKMN